MQVEEFAVRYLVAIEVFVPLAERVMIRQLRPVWNVVVDGFGNHDPGGPRRRQGQRPAWDELHPGRWWSTPEKMPTPSPTSADVSRARIQRHFAQSPPDGSSELAAADEEPFDLEEWMALMSQEMGDD